MHFSLSWYIVSTLAFVCATLALLATGFVFLSILGRLTPLLEDTHDDILELGDLAANTVGHASDTLDIVELRVTEAMGEAEVGAKSATGQVIGIGTALAGLYLVSRFFGMLRGGAKPKPRKKAFWKKLF